MKFIIFYASDKKCWSNMNILQLCNVKKNGLLKKRSCFTSYKTELELLNLIVLFFNWLYNKLMLDWSGMINVSGRIMRAIKKKPCTEFCVSRVVLCEFEWQPLIKITIMYFICRQQKQIKNQYN